LDEPTTNIEPSPQPLPQPSAEQPEPSRGLRWIFVGKNGIRAGWGIALFIVIFIGCALGLNFLIRHLFHPHHMNTAVLTLRMGLISEGLQVLIVLVATAIMALIEHKSLFAYGYQGTARAVRFFFGLAWGFICISALVLVLWKSGLLAFDGQLLHGVTIWRDAILWGLVFLGTGIFEESLLRGYVQYTMTRGIGFWWGALIFSFLFGFGHSTNPGESPIGLFSAGAVGLVFCLSIWYTGSLWWAVGFHAAWDWGQSYFYGTADSGLITRGHLLGEHPAGKLLWSGGLTGPEGSLLIVPLLLIIALGMWLWWGRRVQSPFAGSGWRPAWSRKPRAVQTQNIANNNLEAAS
jgi:uncharacterized protein